jgi:tetratricopeptide (TPR) repeat protein
MTRFVRSPLRTTLTVLTALLLAAPAVAQALPDDAEDALFAARSAMQDAIAQNVDPYPDRPLWAEAIREARRAVELAPTHPRTLGTLAEIYSRTNFYARAWQAWQQYLAAGHGLDAQQTPLYLAVAEEYAWSFYERGDKARAAEIHMEVLDAVSFSKESRVWLGRIRMEQGRPADAIPYWEAVVEQDPDDDRARYFLELATEQARWGVAAVEAFRDGVSYYEEGDLDAASRAFERAAEANPDYPEAWAWRGRVAFERESWVAARSHYARAVELAPGNDTYRYFRDQAQRRIDGEDAAAEAAAAARAEQEAADSAADGEDGEAP